MSVLTPGRIRLSCVSANGKIPKSSLFMVGELFPDVPRHQYHSLTCDSSINILYEWNRLLTKQMWNKDGRRARQDRMNNILTGDPFSSYKR